MNRICYVLIAWFLFSPLFVMGQRIIPSFSMGWGQYNMKELKELQSTITSPVKLHSVNSFPPYFFFKGSILIDIKKIMFGFSWGHYSTGARDHYSDYSGEISIKQLIHADVYSFPIYLKINNEDRLVFSFMFEPGIMSTKYTIREDVRIFDQRSHDKFSDELTTLSFQPGFKLTYSLKRWQPSIDFGYFFDTKLLITSDYQQFNINSVESDYSDFSGIRLSISLAYKIGKDSSL